MNEQLQQSLVQILEKTINGIDSSVAFMQAELPDVISQLLMWYMAKNGMDMVLGVMMTIPFLFFCKKYKEQDILGAESDSFWVTHYSTMNNHIGIGAGMTGAALLLIAFFGCISFVVGAYEVAKIWIAPKIWLIEYAASLAK